MARVEYMPISVFRYALGRMSVVVGTTVDWLIRHWSEFEPHERKIISNELLREIALDHDMPRNGSGTGHLGMECDRREWYRLREWIASRED